MGCGGSKGTAGGMFIRNSSLRKSSKKSTLSSGSNLSEDDGQDEVETVRVYIVRGAVTECFGFGLGVTATSHIFVTDLVSASPAGGAGIEVADRVEKVNGALVQNLTFENTLQRISNSLVLMLECSRLKSMSTTNASLLAASDARDARDAGSTSPSTNNGTSSTSSTIKNGVMMADGGVPVRQKSISELIPNLKMVARRPSVGRMGLSRRPSLDAIIERGSRKRSRTASRRGEKKRDAVSDADVVGGKVGSTVGEGGAAVVDHEEKATAKGGGEASTAASNTAASNAANVEASERAGGVAGNVENEDEDEDEDEDDGAFASEEHAVVLQRPNTEATYGCGLAAREDGAIMIFKVASNIHNWGMLQVGDVVLSVNGVSAQGLPLIKVVDAIEAGTKAELIVERPHFASRHLQQTKRGSVSMALPPGLLLSRLNLLKHERASEERGEAPSPPPSLSAPSVAPAPPPPPGGTGGTALFSGGDGGWGGGPKPPAANDFFASIAGIISAAGI